MSILYWSAILCVRMSFTGIMAIFAPYVRRKRKRNESDWHSCGIKSQETATADPRHLSYFSSSSPPATGTVLWGSLASSLVSSMTSTLCSRISWTRNAAMSMSFIISFMPDMLSIALTLMCQLVCRLSGGQTGLGRTLLLDSLNAPRLVGEREVMTCNYGDSHEFRCSWVLCFSLCYS